MWVGCYTAEHNASSRNKSVLGVCKCTRVKNYLHHTYILQLATLLVGHDAIHMLYFSPTMVVQVWLLTVHFHHEFCAIHMDAPIFICTKEQRAMVHFLWAGLPGAKMHRTCQCSMGTMLCHNRLSKNWTRGPRMVAQAFSMRKQPHVHAGPWLIQTLNKSVKWTCRRQVTTDEVAHKLQISHGSAYEIIHNRLAFHEVFV